VAIGLGSEKVHPSPKQIFSDISTQTPPQHQFADAEALNLKDYTSDNLQQSEILLLPKTHHIANLQHEAQAQ
jgi:hypothetical protein